MTERQQRIKAELARRSRFPNAVKAYTKRLFGKQRDVLADTSKRQLLHSGRRGGKTDTLIAMALRACAANPGMMIPIVERTKDCSAAKAFWKALVDFNETYRVGGEPHHTNKTMTWPNKSVIVFFGADTKEAADKLRGEKYPLVIIDEVGAFRSDVLKYLVTEVAVWATMDLDGSIAMAGTPTPVKAGFMWECRNNEGWSKHCWTALENEAMGPPDMDPAARLEWRRAWLAREMVSSRLTEASSKYIREFLGQWSDSFDDRMYEAGPANVASALPVAPDDAWTYCLGIDVGFTAPSAFVVLGRVEGDARLWVVESYEKAGLIPSVMAARVLELDARYHFTSIVVDEGGAGKGYAEEMRQSFGINCKAAKKTQKKANVEFVNGDLRTGRIQILKSGNEALLEDLASLPWNEDHTDAAVAPRQASADGEDVADDVEVDRYRDHLPDAFLYACREVRAWADTGLGDDSGELTPGSAAWHAAEQARIEAFDTASWQRRNTDPDELDEPLDTDWYDD